MLPLSVVSRAAFCGLRNSACIPRHPQGHNVNELSARHDRSYVFISLSFRRPRSSWGCDPTQPLFQVALFVYRRSGISTAASEVVLRCNIHVSSFITSTSSSFVAWRFVTEATSLQLLLEVRNSVSSVLFLHTIAIYQYISPL